MHMNCKVAQIKAAAGFTPALSQNQNFPKLMLLLLFLLDSRKIAVLPTYPSIKSASSWTVKLRKWVNLSREKKKYELQGQDKTIKKINWEQH